MNRTIKGLFLAAAIFVSAKLLLAVFGNPFFPAYEEKIVLGNWTEPEIEALLERAGEIEDAREKIEFLSGEFLETPYAENTLGGGENLKEVLTADLSGVDCFTYVEYVESLRRSDNFREFRKNLAAVRYKNADVRWEKRRHFFSDWASGPGKNARDVTGEVGSPFTLTALKELNRKADGSPWVPGVSATEREVTYIASGDIGREIIGKIRTGDYLGMYSERDGLDVSHTGIAVRKDGKVYLRHASSTHGKVLDELLSDYIKRRPGLVVYRQDGS